MGKTFRVYKLNQRLLLPPDMRHRLPQGHVALFVLGVANALHSNAGVEAPRRAMNAAGRVILQR